MSYNRGMSREPDDEIEVTPEMMAALADVLADAGVPSLPSFWVEQAVRAVVRAMPQRRRDGLRLRRKAQRATSGTEGIAGPR